MTFKKIAVIAALVAALAGVAVYWNFRAEPSSKTEPRPEVGYPAPDFALTDLDGNTVRLSELRGQPVFINFWATWCPPCREEMPEIQKVYEEKGKKVKFLAIDLSGTEKSTESVRRFLSSNGYTFPVLLDQDGSVAQRYLVRAIPTSFFIDAQGVVSYKHTGPMTRAAMEQVIRKILP